MPNRLSREKSPYLLQHANNPVDWYPWGREAFDKAQREDKPVLVSIGYSACHWCHVMERESFENEETARLMNDRLISIKVDREERPDVDAIYMEAVQALTGQGGWPLNVFLTPDGKPFWGGTYFPPGPGRGLPSWPQVVGSIAETYHGRRADVAQQAEELTRVIRQSQHPQQSPDELSPDLLRQAYTAVEQHFDRQAGGFGGAPKFPQPMSLEFVLRMSRRLKSPHALGFVELTLRHMAEGGIFDHLGGGFHRYTVDGSWIVPHFEKMLYDNALLALMYTHAFQLTHVSWYRTIAEQTLDYLLCDMRSPEGGFYSAEDADSEGEEGKYYLWTPEELARGLPARQAAVAALHYGVQPGGNFEGKTILTVSMPIEEIARRMELSSEDVASLLQDARARMLAIRQERVPPAKDTKIVTSWNALAVRALAQAGRVFGRDDFMRAAEQVAAFLLGDLCPGGRLVRSYKDGPSAIPAFLEDYAFLIEALLTLYETAFNPAYLTRARGLVDDMMTLFWDDTDQAFFDSEASDELVVRPRGLFDNPIPSGNAAAAFALLRLEALTGQASYRGLALPIFRSVRDLLPRAPLAFGYLLCALDFALSEPVQIAIAGEALSADTRALAESVFQRYLPNAVVAVGEPDTSPLLEGRMLREGAATAYVCEHFACQLPVTTARELEALISARE